MYVLKSVFDASVNFVKEFGRGKIEFRYVRRDANHISAYVSSHSGCRMKCKMCHLTATDQTTFNHVSPDLYKAQLSTVLDWYGTKSFTPAKRVNVNFMARGEPLSNRYVVNQWSKIHDSFSELAKSRDLVLKPNISTIMPKHFEQYSLYNTFRGNAYIYYSLYSLNQRFRDKWLPGSMDPYKALVNLKDYQEKSGTEITFHWAYIQNENDSLQEAKQIANVLSSFNFNGKFNLIRYNPPDSTKEPSYERLEELFQIINSGLGNNPKSKIVSRVGLDVKASCGTFMN